MLIKDRALAWLGLHVVTSTLSNFPRSAITWTQCPGSASVQCGFFQVPLDYADPYVGSATLAVARLKATKHPRLGTIFINPGGPGISGIQFLLERGGKVISAVTDGHYDIVGWDPRGVGQSSPQISCGFTSLASYGAFLGNTILATGIEARGNFTDQDDLNAFFARVNETDAKMVEIGQRCLETDGQFLKYMGTAAVVRDMVSLSDAIEGPGKKINFWAFSYGTVIGNYFVNMFPQRVGRVIFDGVVDSIVWATQPTFKMIPIVLAGIESVLQGFAEKCVEAGPQNCSLAEGHATPVSVLNAVRDLINTVYDSNKAGLTNLTSFNVRAFMASELTTPLTWDAVLVPQLEAWTAMFATNASATGNATVPSVHHTSQMYRQTATLKSRQSGNALSNTIDPTLQMFLSELVITCVDSVDQENVQTGPLFDEIVRVTHDVSPTFGEVVVIEGPAVCHRFPIRAVERFTGPFNHNLANPIVIIGNRADPVTSFLNAKKIAATLGERNARLVEQDGLGHTSLAENSDCTQGVARAYLLYGKLPQEGLVCATDQALFPPNNTLVSPNPQSV